MAPVSTGDPKAQGREQEFLGLPGKQVGGALCSAPRSLPAGWAASPDLSRPPQQHSLATVVALSVAVANGDLFLQEGCVVAGLARGAGAGWVPGPRPLDPTFPGRVLGIGAGPLGLGLDRRRFGLACHVPWRGRGTHVHTSGLEGRTPGPLPRTPPPPRGCASAPLPGAVGCGSTWDPRLPLVEGGNHYHQVVGQKAMASPWSPPVLALVTAVLGLWAGVGRKAQGGHLYPGTVFVHRAGLGGERLATCRSRWGTQVVLDLCHLSANQDSPPGSSCTAVAIAMGRQLWPVAAVTVAEVPSGQQV